MHTKDGVYRIIENDGGNFNVTEYAGTSHLTIQKNHSKKKCVCVRFVSGTAIVSPPFWAFVRQWWRHARAVHNVTEQKMNRQKKILSKYLITTLFPIFCVSNISFFFLASHACFLRVFFFNFHFLCLVHWCTNQPAGLRSPVRFPIFSFLFVLCASGRVAVGEYQLGDSIGTWLGFFSLSCSCTVAYSYICIGSLHFI